MENTLKLYLENGLDAQDFMIHYHIGNSFSGETNFELRGDGAYALWSTVTEGRQRREYNGTTERQQVAEIAQTMLALRLWEVKHVAKERGLDNPEVRITVSAKDETFSVVLWANETAKVAAFKKVQNKILHLIHSLSNGEVLEVGR